ncbi:MAG: hypothetical protein MI754_01755, partial [Chromatiales bacterium]|nr:hypothetical protein [Chromatiales bacterium]
MIRGRWRNWTAQLRKTGGLLLIVVTAAVISAILTDRIGEQNHVEKTRQHLEALATELDNRFFIQTQRDLRAVATLPVIQQTAVGQLPKNNPEALAAMQVARDASDSVLVYLLNRNGTTVAGTPYNGGKSLVGNNYAFRPYFKRVVEKGELTFYPAQGVT